jgi:hypothetical protein
MVNVNARPSHRQRRLMSTNGREPFALRKALKALGGKLDDWTVMSNGRDPFRLDTPIHHENGLWLRDKIAELRLSMPRHIRGLHYIFVVEQVVKPNGEVYRNYYKDFDWLGDFPVKAARWLNYVPFEDIVDERNDEPVPSECLGGGIPSPEMFLDTEFSLPDDLVPLPDVANLSGEQPYRIVLWGEKSSLREVLGDISKEYNCDLFLDAGDDSDTHIHQLARIAEEDGRPIVVLTFCDCDLWGWRMPITLSHKLSAHQIREFPNMKFRVHRVGLTPDQVREYDLPVTPLRPEKPSYDKKTGERLPTPSEKWIAATGTQQTEIDALAAVRPELFNEIAVNAIRPFYDSSLGARVERVRNTWIAQAEQAIEEQADHQLRRDVEAELARMRERAAELIALVKGDISGIELPPAPGRVEAVLTGVKPVPLVDSGWPLRDRIHSLLDSQAEVGLD